MEMTKQAHGNSLGQVETDGPYICPLCGGNCRDGVGRHIRSKHGKVEWERAVIAAKDAGVSDREIGRRFNVSFNTLSKLIMRDRGSGSFGKKLGAGVSKSLNPSSFEEETTALWSFRDRGSWAVHRGHYRGNWSPYIPRNLILHYTEPGERVLDCFTGGGTTAIESLLLGRNFTGMDINPEAVRLSTEAIEAIKRHPRWNAQEAVGVETSLDVGNAMHMTAIGSGSADLICAHPPYAEIIKYSESTEDDLSSFRTDRYLEGMSKVASECLRVLKPSGRCAILVGDKRKQKRVVPLGFSVIQSYLDNGFQLDELIIKRQFNTRTTGLWYNKAIQWKFLLMAHEYLPVFSRNDGHSLRFNARVKPVPFHFSLRAVTTRRKGWTAESTTVWKAETRHSIIENFRRLTSDGKVKILEVGEGGDIAGRVRTSVIVDLTPESGRRGEVARRRGMLSYLTEKLAGEMRAGSLLGISTRDVRSGGKLWPMGLVFWKDMTRQEGFALREIVITYGSRESPKARAGAGYQITHAYLLIYEKS